MSEHTEQGRATRPGATYRLQLGEDLDFDAAAGLVDLIAGLGVTHVYLSPIMTAAPGSTHGYDVADPSRVADALGGESALRRLADTAHAAGLGLVVDVVPNHMAADLANPHWRTLLAEGRTGPAGAIFDVDWRPAVPGLVDRVVVPMLGDRYGVVLERGELGLVEEDGRAWVSYYDHRLPVSQDAQDAVERAGGAQAFMGTPGDLPSWSRLHALLEAQAYRLVHWRVGDELVNYRRFFTISGLAAVRVEDPEVFDLVHEKILQLMADGVVDGLRIDHPDGLRDPARYFERLSEATDGAWVVAEKITHPGELLPDWPVAGTTGYETANDLLGVLAVDPAGSSVLEALDRDLGGAAVYSDAAVQGIREKLDTGLAADVDRLAGLLWAVSQEHPEARDVSLRGCRSAVEALVAGFDVYRPYVDPQTGEATEADREVVGRALDRALAESDVATWLLEHLAALVLGDVGTSPEHLEVVARFPQLTSAAIAKGTEDTAFYRFRRLLAVNEVGGDPGVLGLDVDAFHRRTSERAAHHPAAMLTTATHDTKRGEDTRLRMAALSELADDWVAACRGWGAEVPAPLDGQVGTLVWQTMAGVWPLEGEPDALWRHRVVAYLVKAEREAAVRTTWTDPDEAVEDGIGAYVDHLLADEPFLSSFTPLAQRAAEIAMVTGVSQVLLRCTLPGVPDTYQGMERWDDHLVDPDNRRAVDWDDRRALLSSLEDADVTQLWPRRRDGRVKAHVLRAALRARRDAVDALGPEAGYEPLEVTGLHAERVVAFARRGGSNGAVAVVVAPRLPAPLVESGGVVGDAWGDTAVAVPQRPGPWIDRLSDARSQSTGGRLRLADVLTHLPVALLTA